MYKAALAVVDVQNDFLPGGSLAVNDGFAILPVIRHLLELPWQAIIVSRDWHPKGHISFASSHKGKRPFADVRMEGDKSYVLWPDHCIQQSKGAELHDDLKEWLSEPSLQKNTQFVDKGTDIDQEAFSAFDTTTQCASESSDISTSRLTTYLRENGITNVYVCGLATDYCVKATVQDSVKDGFTTYVVQDACRGIGNCPWENYGGNAHFVQSTDVVNSL